MAARAKTDWEKKVADRLVAKAHYYDEARKLARIASRFPVDENGDRHFVVCSGGGPSFMEAANRGATEAGHLVVGLEQGRDEVGSEHAGCAGDEDVHAAQATQEA